MSRCGKLRQVFDSTILSLTLKLAVYKAAVVSTLTYGSEAWHLTEETKARLNGANARALSRFTGKSAHEETSKYKRTFDIVAAVRNRRYKWLGHILRLEGPRLVKLAVKAQYDMALPGNICMDAPPSTSFEDLIRQARDRKGWADYWERRHQSQDNGKRKQKGRWIGSGADAVWMEDDGTPDNDTNASNQANPTDNSTPSPRKRTRRDPNQSLVQAEAWRAIFDNNNNNKINKNNKNNNNKTTNTTTPTTTTLTTLTPTPDSSMLSQTTTTNPSTITLSAAAPTFTPTTMTDKKSNRNRRKRNRRRKRKATAPQRVTHTPWTNTRKRRWAQAHWYQNHGYRVMPNELFESSESDSCMSDSSPDVTTDAYTGSDDFIPHAFNPDNLLPDRRGPPATNTAPINNTALAGLTQYFKPKRK